MHDKYPVLLSPIRIGNNIIKNRMICPPSKPHFIQGPENFPSENIIAHYAARAKNGAGIVTCDGTHMTEPNPDFHMMGWNAKNGAVQHYMAQMADAVHYYGSKAHTVIMASAPREYDVSTGVATHYVVGDGSKPRYDAKELPNEVVYEIIENLAQQALLSKHEGFDGTYIHMSYRGVLPGRFLSPMTNKRTDEFGGSFENRTRFSFMLCKRIKELCGRDFMIDASVSGHDPIADGWTIEDAIRFAKDAESLIDIMTVRAPEIDPQHPTGFTLEHMPWLYMAEAIKKSNPNIVIAASGGCFYPDECEAALASGKADMLSMARTFVSNPEYGKLLYEGRSEDIVPCLRCNKCHRTTDADPWLSVCVVNPVWAQEQREMRMEIPAEGGKQVAIVGGGPAGMQAALVSAERGNNVTIYEKTDKLGGLINHADTVSFKWPMKDYRDYLVHQVLKNPHINVRLGETVDAKQLSADGYEVVLAAVGSTPIIPTIPGIDSANVIPAIEVFGNEGAVKGDVVVIGGGEIGVETGLHLAQMGHKVTVVEMLGMLAPEAYRVHYYSMFIDAVEKEDNITCILNARCTSISDKGITYVDADNNTHEINAETVVLAAGMRSNMDLAMEYSSAGKLFYAIGDCGKMGNLQKALRNAYDIAHTF